MGHETLADTVEELERIAMMLRIRLRDLDSRRELLAEELRRVEEKKHRLEQKT
jgi:prefoldin subunit 5